MSPAGPRHLHGFIAVLVAVYCVKQLLVAFIFPPFTGHDEVAHFQNVRILATEGRLATLFHDTLPDDLYEYNRYALGWGEEWQRYNAPLYTALHPPFYYILMVPVYRAVAGSSPETQQYLLRCAAIPFGLIGLLLAYRLTTTVFPGDRFLALTVPTVIAFQPQMSYEAAMVNNDVTAIALYSGLLYLLVKILRDGITPRRAAAVGVVFGLGLLAKTTTATALPLIIGAFWFARDAGNWRRVFGMLVIAGTITLVLDAPWYAFMYQTYGDFTGLTELSKIQYDLTSNASFFQLLMSGRFLAERWAETWGEFGWRLIPISGWLLSGTAAVALVACAGLPVQLVATVADSDRFSFQDWQWKALLLLAAAVVLSYLAVVQFGTRFALTQARYYFPAANAAALLGMFGLRAWIPQRYLGLAQVALVAGLVALNVVIYTAHVVPYWYFRP